MPDNGKPGILLHGTDQCQSFVLAAKKNATRTSRVKSTPKEEGGGDKQEYHEAIGRIALCSDPIVRSRLIQDLQVVRNTFHHAGRKPH